jgi:threonyl-tRNA synthetase
VQLIPIADRHLEYAERVASELREARLRVEVDARREKINAKIRDAQLLKIPYMLVVGDKEVADNAVSVRLRTEENLGAMPVSQFKEMAVRNVEERSSQLT